MDDRENSRQRTNDFINTARNLKRLGGYALRGTSWLGRLGAGAGTAGAETAAAGTGATGLSFGSLFIAIGTVLFSALFFTIIIALIFGGLGFAKNFPSSSSPNVKANIKFRCQYDSRWTTNSCNITHFGCDPTALSTIVSSYGNTDLDPLTVASKNGEMGCQGATTMDDIANSLNWVQGLGFTVAEENLAFGRDFNLQGAKKYIDQGYLILGVANVRFKPSGSGGHSFVITGVDPSSQNLTVLDPTYCTSDDNYMSRTLNVSEVFCRHSDETSGECGWYLARPIKK